jgi:AcrR family transcriptional regulator
MVCITRRVNTAEGIRAGCLHRGADGAAPPATGTQRAAVLRATNRRPTDRTKDRRRMAAPRDRETRRRIHRLAAELFAKNGYHGTGMSELSDVVGLGRGALYYHISSKEAVLFAITTEAIDQLLEPSEVIVQCGGTAEERLRALARVLMRNIADLSNEWTVFFREHSALTGQWHVDIMDRRERYEALWARVLDDGAAAGEFTDVPPVVLKGILGMFNYSYLWLRAEGTASPEQVADAFCDVLLRGLSRTPGRKA